MAKTAKPRVFIDSDVLIAGSVSSTGASFILLQLAELGIIDCLISNQVKLECERNLQEKLPQGLPAYRLIVESTVKVVKDPNKKEIASFEGQAHHKDLSILTSALTNKCHYLITFNVKHYYPKSKKIKIFNPGQLLLELREQFLGLIKEKD